MNFWGVVHGTKEFLPHLIASGDGHLVNISSLFGLISVAGLSRRTTPRSTPSAASPRPLREEMLVAGHPVGVTCVHPGGIKTGIVRNGRVTARREPRRGRGRLRHELARMSPERAAAIIVKAVLTSKPRQLVGLDAHVLHHFASLVGARYQDVVVRVGRRRFPERP